jgi:hypothetical protein
LGARTRTLPAIAEAVGALTAGQERHDQVLTERSQALAEHGRALTDITEMLRRLTDGA